MSKKFCNFRVKYNMSKKFCNFWVKYEESSIEFENLSCLQSIENNCIFLHIFFSFDVKAVFRSVMNSIDLFPKRHRKVHHGKFPKFRDLYCSLNMVSSTEVS